MAWVDEACGGFFAKEQAGTLKQTDVYVFRVAAMLDDFAVHGSVLRRYSRSSEQAERRAGRGPRRGFRRGCGRVVARSRRSGRMARSRGSSSRSSASRGGLAALDGGVIGAFVVTSGRLPAEDGGAQAVRGAGRCCGSLPAGGLT